MLNFYYSTTLEQLADKLLHQRDENPRKNLLAPEIFVVQNHGIGQWLSLEMADRTEQKISANLKFEFPSERIWSLIRRMDANIPQTLPSDRGPMTWTLMQLLKDDQFLNNFSNLSHYIQEDDPGQQALRSWKLSNKIANVFDQYLIYRPELILGWQDRKLQTDQPAERWQLKLWNRLVTYWNNNYDGDWLHRAELQQELLKRLENGKFTKKDLPERISVFAVSSLPPVFIEILTELATEVDINFYQLNVNPEIKQSDGFQNPLLQSLGKEGANFMSLFSDQANIPFQSVDETQTAGTNDSLFRTVQSDIIHDEPASQLADNVPVADPSIQVYSCHSAMREVEVLYDRLLAAMDEDPELNPEDILIMTPDIETYAPVIEAVFEAPDEGQPKIPYHIADRGIGGRPAVDSFLNILELCDSRFKVTDVLDLLDARPIRQSFEFTEDDLNRLSTWVQENRIRWGIDGDFKEQMGLPNSDHFTWRSGINRMLAGYAMRADKDSLYDGIFPYDEIATSRDAALAGRFSRFMRALYQTNDRTGKTKSVPEWEETLTQMLDIFLPDNQDFHWEISRIREALGQLTDQADLAALDQEVPFQIVRQWLQEQLKEQTTGGGRLGRGVTFSSLKPMRSIPFEIIGMIGMNEGTFPRSKIPIEFDLMHLDPQDGDPQKTSEDRYLFLENLLSARKALYFSYLGQSNRQDSTFPPSVVLTEFLDYLENTYNLSPEELVTEHPLQSFSPQYFREGEPSTYSEKQANISKQLMQGGENPHSFMDSKLPEPGDEWRQLSVNDLISFFQHPAEYLLRKRLGIYLGDEEAMTDHREPFTLEKLDKYQVKQELLERYLNEQPLNKYDENLSARDMLPEGWIGRQAYQQKSDEAQEFGTAIIRLLDQQQMDDCEVDLQVNGFQITGRLTHIFPQLKLQYRFGHARPKDRIEWWIRHLLFQQVKPQKHSGRSLLLTWDEKSLQQHHLSAVTDAEGILKDLLDLYWEGIQQPIDLYCQSSYAYAESMLERKKDEESAFAKAEKAWEPSWNGSPGEGDDPYNKLITNATMPFDDTNFSEVSRAFWAPYFEALNQEEV